MEKIKEIKTLNKLTHKLFKESKNERHALFKYEYPLDVTPLGELEVFSDTIAGVVYSISKGHRPVEHLSTLKNISLEKDIPHLPMLKKYPLLFEYAATWEKLRLLCIEYLE